MTQTQIKTTVLPAGPTKRVWVNKAHLPQFGGTSPTAPVWEVECFPVPMEAGVRYSGFEVVFYGLAWCAYVPNDGDGPHAWLETSGQMIIYTTAAEEAA